LSSSFPGAGFEPAPLGQAPRSRGTPSSFQESPEFPLRLIKRRIAAKRSEGPQLRPLLCSRGPHLKLDALFGLVLDEEGRQDLDELILPLGPDFLAIPVHPDFVKMDVEILL